MAADEIHVGDTGTAYTMVVKDGATVVDISGATGGEEGDLLIFFEDPDGATVEYNASKSGSGTDGKMYVTSTVDTWDQAGDWSAQGEVTLGGSTWRTDVHRFVVHPNLA